MSVLRYDEILATLKTDSKMKWKKITKETKPGKIFRFFVVIRNRNEGSKIKDELN